MNKQERVMGLMIVCVFKREANSPWEAGIMLDEGAKGYLDRYGNLLENVWEAKNNCTFMVDMAPILTHSQKEVEEWEARRNADIERSRAFQEKLKQEKAGKRPRLSKQSNTCMIDGCEKEAKAAKGLCWMHYRRNLRHGSTDDPEYINSGKTCSVEGCTDDAHNKGLCQVHLQRFNKYGDVHYVSNLRGQMDPVCRVDGCDEPTIAYHLCNKHHANFRYHRGINAKDSYEYIEKKNKGEI